jgi:ArsR family transcriptional regulator, arsenate/arsenite/antimonite-responsive transcriptional repressor
MVTQISNRAQRVAASLPLGLFKALAEPNRIALVGWLALQRQARTVTEIAQSGCCPTDLSVVSRHLAMLRDGGVLDAERRGREVYYRVAIGPVAAALRRMADLLETCCPPPKE